MSAEKNKIKYKLATPEIIKNKLNSINNYQDSFFFGNQIFPIKQIKNKKFLQGNFYSKKFKLICKMLNSIFKEIKTHL